MTMIIEILQLWGCHRLSKNFFKRIPAFWQKNVRCNMKGIFSFTENLHLIPHIFSKKSVVKWGETLKLALVNKIRTQISKNQNQKIVNYTPPPTKLYSRNCFGVR